MGLDRFNQGLIKSSTRIQKGIPSLTPSIYNDSHEERRIKMLYTIALILIVLWLLGIVSSYTIGGFIHILLVIAIIAVLLRIIRGRKPF
jgi:hypothetical protein